MSLPAVRLPRAAGDAAGRILVTGGGATEVDTEELAALVRLLERVADEVMAARFWAQDAHAHLDTWGYLAPEQAAPLAQLLESCVHGPEGALRLEADLDELADRVVRARVLYLEAEQHVTEAFRPSVGKYLWYNFAVAGIPQTELRLTPLTLTLPLLTLANLAEGRRNGDPAAVTAQRTVRESAEELQHAFPYYRREPVVVGGAEVDPRTLTPVQRVALGIVPSLGSLAQVLHLGRPPQDVQVRPARLGVTPRPPGTPGTGPPSATWTVPRLPVRLVSPPRSEADVLRRAGELSAHGRAAGAGAVEILRATGADGRRRWTVIVPGMQSTLVGGADPMDNLTNVQAMAGVVSDMEIGVATAMRQAGIAPGEQVAMAVHSQGALVATRLLRDPLFAARYRVTALLTAGGPLGGLAVPEEVATLSLEDIDDPVVGLDGLSNAPAAHHLTVALDTRGLEPGLSPHEVGSYANGAELIEHVEDPAVRQWRAEYRSASGLGRAGTTTDSMLFEITRQE